MTTEQIEPGIIGAKRASWRRGNTRKLLLQIIEKYPKATEAKWQSLFLDAVKEDAQRWMEGEIDSENSLFITTVYSHFANVKVAVERGVDRPDEPEVKIARKVEREREVLRVKEKVKQRVVDEARIMVLQLDTALGKKLGACSKQDLEILGGWHSALAKLVPARKCLADVASEDRVWALLKTQRK